MARYCVEKVGSFGESCIIIDDADSAVDACEKAMPWAASDPEVGVEEAEEVTLRAARLDDSDSATKTIVAHDGKAHYLGQACNWQPNPYRPVAETNYNREKNLDALEQMRRTARD